MRTNSSHHQHEEGFTILRTSLSRLILPLDLVDELIERHIAVVYEKGAMAFCEGNTDGIIACILSGYVKVYCPVGDGNRTLVRLAGPGEIIGYYDYLDTIGILGALEHVLAKVSAKPVEYGAAVRAAQEVYAGSRSDKRQLIGA